MPLNERCFPHSITEQSEPPGLWTDHQWVVWRQPAARIAQGNSWEWRQRHGGLGLGGKWVTPPELLEDHQSHVFKADKKATKDFQDKLAMNQLTGLSAGLQFVDQDQWRDARWLRMALEFAMLLTFFVVVVHQKRKQVLARKMAADHYEPNDSSHVSCWKSAALERLMPKHEGPENNLTRFAMATILFQN